MEIDELITDTAPIVIECGKTAYLVSDEPDCIRMLVIPLASQDLAPTRTRRRRADEQNLFYRGLRRLLNVGLI